MPSHTYIVTCLNTIHADALTSPRVLISPRELERFLPPRGIFPLSFRGQEVGACSTPVVAPILSMGLGKPDAGASAET